MYTDLVQNNTIDKDVKKYVLNLCNSAWKIFDFSLNMHSALLMDGSVNEDTIQHSLTEPSVVHHTLVIESFLKFGKVKGALKAYWGMLAAGVAPNSYTYTVLIKGLTADPLFSGDAKKCLLEMMKKGMRPNAATYIAVVESFAKKGDKGSEEECKELVEVMVSKGFVPNAKAMREVLKGRPKAIIRGIMNIVLSKLKG
ncbi:PREDICTED: pentatricopeptide repeat-containing protein At5g65560-like [Fragaria vesca subsp. vesca]